MKNHLILMGIIILLIVTTLSGCQEQEAIRVQNKFEGITLESNIFELDNASLEFHRDEQNNIIKIDVKYLFHNIAGRDVTAIVTVEFYDKNDNLLAIGGPNKISLPIGYVEPVVLPANLISYNGEYVSEVDHVKIIAIE